MTVQALVLGVDLAQKAYDSLDCSERTALKELLSTLDLEGVLALGGMTTAGTTTGSHF